jgi:ubiquinone biosynthesis protein
VLSKIADTVIRRRGRSDARPVRVRRMLEDLGPTYTKLGQLVAGQPDLVPERYRQELGRLRDHVTPLPPDVALGVLAHAYTAPLEEIFPTFIPEPIAAASIGQVHRATIADGRAVAVKIRRPEAAAVIEADLAVLDASVRILAFLLPSVRRLDPRALLTEFAVALRQELDYELEATHTTEIAASLDRLPWVTVPRVIAELCRPDVLVLEFIEGVALTDAAGLARTGFDRHTLGSEVIAANLQLILFSDVYQADPHPGNYLVTAGGSLVMLDFGEVGHSDRTTRAELLLLLSSLAVGDAARVTEAVEAITGTDTRHDAALGEDVAAFVDSLSEHPLVELKIGPVLHDMVGLLRRHQLALPAALTMLIKAVVEFEATAAEIYAGLRFADVLPLALGLAERHEPAVVPSS